MVAFARGFLSSTVMTYTIELIMKWILEYMVTTNEFKLKYVNFFTLSLVSSYRHKKKHIMAESGIDMWVPNIVFVMARNRSVLRTIDCFTYVGKGEKERWM